MRCVRCCGYCVCAAVLQCSESGGAGGGVILLNSINLMLSGNISADGVPGTLASQAGGGSGGSVSIRTLCYPQGNGFFTANGGSGQGGGGGGGGGRMLFSILEPFDVLAPRQLQGLSRHSAHGAGVDVLLGGDMDNHGVRPGDLSLEGGASICANSTLFSGTGTVAGGGASTGGVAGSSGGCQ